MVSDDLNIRINIPGIWIADSSGAVKLLTEDILYCHHINDVTRIIYSGGRIKRAHVPLKKIEEKLGTEKFYRCHRNYLVNLEQVFEYNQEGECIRIRKRHTVPVSRRRRNGLRLRLINFSADRYNDD